MRAANEPEDLVTKTIIGRAMAIHSELGPGLLESVYEYFLTHELRKLGFRAERQQPVPVEYDGLIVDLGFRADIIVNDEVLIEIKAVEKLAPIHEAQILNYLRLSGIERGLLINFHSDSLKDGIRRFSLTKKRLPGG